MKSKKLEDYWKLRTIKANMRSNALNFNVSSSIALNNVSEEILSLHKKEGSPVISNTDGFYEFLLTNSCRWSLELTKRSVLNYCQIYILA